MSFNGNGVQLKGQFHLKNTDPIDSRYVITSQEEYNALIEKDDSNPKFLYPGLTFTVTADEVANGKGVYRVATDGTMTINKLEFSSPSATGTTTSFIDTVSQTDGKVSATKKTISTATKDSKGIVQIGDNINVTEGGTISIDNYAGSDTAGGPASRVKAALSFGTNGSGTTSSYDGSVARSISYNSVGAAPKSHASTETTYGAASDSNYGHAKASTTSPKANGTAHVGSETSSFARGDHVHPNSTEKTILLAEDLYTYTPIGLAQTASNYIIGTGNTISQTNPGLLGNANDSLKSVFNKIFGIQEDTQPTVSNNASLSVSAGTTSYGGGEFGTAVESTTVSITFTLANSGTANFGYRCGTAKSTGSQTFYYPVIKQSTGDIKITLPSGKIASSSMVKAGTFVSASSNVLYCNFNSSKQVTIQISLPAGSVNTVTQTRYGQISASVQLGNAQKENQLTAGTAITKFLTYLGNDATETTKLSGGTKSNTAGAYTISNGSYYPYYLASTSTSLSNNTNSPVTTAIKFSSTTTSSSVSVTLSSNAYVWFLLPPSASGSKTIQYEALGQWYTFDGGTTGPSDVALKLDSGAIVTYKGYRTTKQAAAGITSFKII